MEKQRYDRRGRVALPDMPTEPFCTQQRKQGPSSAGPMDSLRVGLEYGKFVVVERRRGVSCHKSQAGRVVKFVDTSNFEDDAIAGRFVGAELERIRGEMRDPSLEVIQLTDNGSPPIWTNEYVIYRPKPD